MCGRFMFSEEQSEEIRRIAQAIDAKYGRDAWHQGDICPSGRSPVLVAHEGEIRPELYQWGYQISKTLIINARAETAAEKQLFRDDVAQRRCVIPASGFYEWDGSKRKFLFTMPEADMLYMAGIYAVKAEQARYCILTTAANASMRDVHNRMPLILRREQIAPWLNEPQHTEEILHLTPPLLQKAAADTQLSLW